MDLVLPSFKIKTQKKLFFMRGDGALRSTSIPSNQWKAPVNNQFLQRTRKFHRVPHMYLHRVQIIYSDEWKRLVYFVTEKKDLPLGKGRSFQNIDLLLCLSVRLQIAFVFRSSNIKLQQLS